MVKINVSHYNFVALYYNFVYFSDPMLKGNNLLVGYILENSLLLLYTSSFMLFNKHSKIETESKPNSLSPTVSLNKNKYIVCLFDCENDILISLLY